MPRVVKGGLIQIHCGESADQPMEKIKQNMIDKHVPWIEKAASDVLMTRIINVVNNGQRI